MRLASDGNADDPAFFVALGLPGTVIEAVEIVPEPAMMALLPPTHAVIDGRIAVTFDAPQSGRVLVSLTSVFVFYSNAQPIVGWWDVDADREVGHRRTLGGGSQVLDSTLIGATSSIDWVLDVEPERTYHLALAGSSANAACYMAADNGIELGVGPILVKVIALACPR